MSYIYWLLLLSALFVALERLFPWRRGQALLRPGWLRDLGFLVTNGHFFGVWMAPVFGWVAVQATHGLTALGLAPAPAAVARWPFLAQFVALLVVSDFVQWLIHNLLHRVPWLWAFHKVHHSIPTMDWIGSFHFHVVEIVVYKTLQWLPLAFFGASDSAIMAVAVVGTWWGHFNHSNLNLGLGPLGWVFNSPRMHLWHHDASSEGGTAKNFGIVLSVWDAIFRTAFWPRERNPERIGYPGDVEMPSSFVGQALWPLGPRVRDRVAS